MPETSYSPDPRPTGFQTAGSRQLAVGFPFDSLVDRRTVIRLSLAVSSVTLLVNGNTKLVGVMIRNVGSAPAIVGPDNTIGTTSATGFPVIGAGAAGGGAPVFIRTSATIWVNSTGTAIDVTEFYRL